MQNLSAEEKQLVSRLEDRLERVEQRYTEEVTDFLEPRQQLVAEAFLRSVKFDRYLFCGGFAAAERKRLLLYQAYSEPSCEQANICLLRFVGRMEYASASHRDFLGAVMSVGLRREKLGDLLVTEQGCDLFVAREVAAYLLQNELRVRHVPLQAQEIALQDFQPPEQTMKEIHIMVSSMRLDAVLAGSLGLSRAKAVALIQSGRIKVNHSEMQANDYLCRETDLISCRGYGRLRVGEQLGETRKGKWKVRILKYI